MGWILRTSNDANNPTIPGGVYGLYITIGRGVYWFYDGSRTRYIIFISDGGRYGLDSVQSVEFNGAAQDEADWIFHPGTLTAQISPVNVSAIDTGTDVLTSTAHPFNDGDLVRLGIIEGQLPAAIDPDLKYQISDDTANTFKLKDEAGASYIDFADDGTGQVIIWKADAGFDDPVQGLPTFAPEVLTTFSNIAYIEGKLTAGVSSSEAPNWSLFRIIGTGRRLMDYDASGNELGLLPVGDDDLSNVALQIADNSFVSHQVDVETRFDWPSWKALRDAADILVWQRVVETDEEPEAIGFVGRYFNGTIFGGSPIVTRTDPGINFGGTGDVAPAPGITPSAFSIRWNGIIKPLYTETYTFTITHDNTVRFFINGVQILEETSVGTHTVTYMMAAGLPYEVQIDFVQLYGVGAFNLWECRFYWQSASQAYEIVPATATTPTDRGVKRYENHTAFPVPTEANEVHERLMERVPGWDWTEDDGKVTFLPPDRPVVYTFGLDRNDDDSVATFTTDKFEKKKRGLPDRPNFLLFRFRDVEREGYPNDHVHADREDLRRFTGGEPTNTASEELGVMTRSLAERLAEFEMVLKSDPKHTYNVSGGRASGAVRKNQKVQLFYYDNNNILVADEEAITTFHSWGSVNGQNDFSLLPVNDPIYSDEPFAFSNAAFRINSGGVLSTPFIADANYTGGAMFDWATAIDISHLTDPAPEPIYRDVRYNPHSYMLPGFAAHQYVQLRFHFSDEQSTTGVRVFDIRVQGVVPSALRNIDIAALVGNVAYKGWIIEYVAKADASGDILIEVEDVSGAYGGLIAALEAFT